jgi:hypothetical protein
MLREAERLYTIFCRKYGLILLVSLKASNHFCNYHIIPKFRIKTVSAFLASESCISALGLYDS